MRVHVGVLLAGFGAALAAAGQLPRPAPPPGFAPPERLLDGAAFGARLHPHYADFDGDGTVDQLVGVWDRLLVFRNRGTTAAPEYAPPAYFDAAEPSARLPAG